MGNLIKVAGLGLFAAIGIASAVAVATHFQPTISTSKLTQAELFGDTPSREDAVSVALQPILLQADQTSSQQTVTSPALLQPDNLPAAQADTDTVGTVVPTSSWRPVSKTAAPPTGPSTGPVTAPPVMSPVEPTSDRSNSETSLAKTGLQDGDRTGWDQSLAQSINSLVAGYQPLIMAQFDRFGDALHKIEQTQEETAQIVTKLQDDQNRQPVPAEDATPPPPGTTSAAPDVSMNDDKWTLLFEDSDIKEVLNAIGTEAGLNILMSESVSGLVSATLTDVEIQTALDAVLKSRGLVSRREGNIVYVGTHEELHFVEYGGDVISTRIYRLNYITALDMQSLITPMLSQSSGQVTVSTASEVGIASDSASAGGDSFSGEEVVMVRDFDGILAQIDELVAEVDRMPRQVSIEAMILSVALNDKSELGVDFELLRQKDTLRITSGTPLIDLATAPFTDGLKMGFLDSSVFMFLNALETIGDTNVVASPRIMCLNKQRAEILIGAELGYISTTITETAATQSGFFAEFSG